MKQLDPRVMITFGRVHQLFSQVFVIFLPLISLIAIHPLPASAHITVEKPWHPATAAYLRSLFYVNLKPTNWEWVAKEFSTAINEPGYNQFVFDYSPSNPMGIEGESPITRKVFCFVAVAIRTHMLHPVSHSLHRHQPKSLGKTVLCCIEIPVVVGATFRTI